MNYYNKDLRRVNLDGQDLNHELFRGSDLRGASFVGANLTFANMRECNIEGADFTNAILHYVNLKDSTGTAIFKNARTKMAPKWVEMTDADNITDPPDPTTQTGRRDLINALFAQANVTIDSLDDYDKQSVLYFISNCYDFVLYGDYGIMPEGNMVYDVLSLDHAENAFSTVVNAHIAGNVYYNEETKTFVKGEEDG